MTYPTNQTLQDFMDVYAETVVSLRRSNEHLQSQCDYQKESIERAHKLAQEDQRAKDKIAADLTVEKKHAAKLKGIIDSLKLELQESRAAHTAIRADLEAADGLVTRIYDTITDDGTEKAKVITVHSLITEHAGGHRGGNGS